MHNLNEFTVKRLFINPDIKKDRFDILYPDGTAVNCGYKTACDFMLNRLDPDQLRQSQNGGNGVFLV